MIRTFRLALGRSWLAAIALGMAGTVLAADSTQVPGYVDKTPFVELGGDDSLRVEVNVHKSLIKLFCAGLDAELKEVACGLDSIGAVILELEDKASRDAAKALVDQTAKDLKKKGWERLALVREDDAVVHVMVLNDEESISGLVVMVIDHSGGEVVFTNIAGELNLEAMQQLAEELDIPGLRELDGIDR